ncbi:MAG TPA: hypothetical protein VJ343_02475 [archaeon]|nr:hypothetical protein [archaeon]
METVLSFVTKFSDVVKKHIEETKECVGKSIVDSNATKTGICVDRIKLAYGARFSLLGQKYSDVEAKQLEAFSEDVLVCQGNDGNFFIPMSDILAMGGSLILVRTALDRPETGEMGRKKDEAYRKFFTAKESIKKILPGVENPIRRKKKKMSVFQLLH